MSVLFVDGFEEYDMPSVPQGRYDRSLSSDSVMPDQQRRLLEGLAPRGARIVGWMVWGDPQPALTVVYEYPGGATEQRQYILGSTTS